MGHITDPVLIIGIILFVGFIMGELADRLNLPRVTGYITAGIILNPQLIGVIPKQFTQHMDTLTRIAMAFITFSIGGELKLSKLKEKGSSILTMTFFEAEISLLIVAVGSIFLAPALIHIPNATFATVWIPFALLLAVFASPTDPSATLAVIHEYKAKGEVTSTILGISAFDDTLGIINFSIVLTVSRAIAAAQPLHPGSALVESLVTIVGAVAIGAVFGLLFSGLTHILNKGDKIKEGTLIVIVFALMLLCSSASEYLGFDSLLATMSMGAFVVNLCKSQKDVFSILERYTDQLVFLLFFTASGMQLNLSALKTGYVLIGIFVLLRTVGKLTGIYVGATLAKAGSKLKKYTAGGLIPQGGIVAGLALMVKKYPEFDSFSSIIITVIIGATVLHEILGPAVSKTVLSKAGELNPDNNQQDSKAG